MQALRAVEPYLNLDALYVLGTNCVDNGPRQGLDKFLRAASSEPETVLHYEFMQARSLSACMQRPHVGRHHWRSSPFVQLRPVTVPSEQHSADGCCCMLSEAHLQLAWCFKWASVAAASFADI